MQPTPTGQLVGPPAAGVSEVEIDGRICLYAPGSEQVVVLNDTASDVWRLADGERTLAELVDLLAASYGVEAASILGDVQAAVEQFRAAALLAQEPQA
jgi:hypothetical protein